MGVSAWREIGRAYGYWDSWLEQTINDNAEMAVETYKKELREKVEILKFNGNCNNQLDKYENYCQAIDDVLAIIEKI